MLLSGEDIKEQIKKGDLKITPYDESLVGPDSIDIRLGNKLLIAQNIHQVVDAAKPENFWEEEKFDKDGFMLMPGQFALGTILEKVSIPEDLAAQIEGRSSVGRLGLMVHVTAGLIHAGFGMEEPANITLEMYSVNPNPLKIYPGMKIAQLSFTKLSNKTKGYDKLKKSQYVGQRGPSPPKTV